MNDAIRDITKKPITNLYFDNGILTSQFHVENYVEFIVCDNF